MSPRRHRRRLGAVVAGALLLASLLASRASRAAAQEEQDVQGEQETQAPEEQAEPELEPPTLQGALSVGLGVGQRGVALPSGEGVRTIETGLFPALDVLVRADGRFDPHSQLGLHLRYQTSLGISASEMRPGRVERSTSARTHHLDAGLVPAVRFTDTPDSVVLGVFIGWGFRSFSTVVPLSVPSYTLHGPMARLELRVPINGDLVALTVRPEVFAWLWQTDELRELGAIDQEGIAFGVEAGLDVRLSERLRLALSHRESHGSIGTGFGTFTDVERFFSLQLVLVY